MAQKLYWFRRQTEPDPTTPKAALRYTGKVEIFKSPSWEIDGDDSTRLLAVVDSVEVAQKMVELANETYETHEATER